MGKLVAYWIGIMCLWGVVAWALLGCSPVAPIIVDGEGGAYLVQAKGKRPMGRRTDRPRIQLKNPCRGGVVCHVEPGAVPITLRLNADDAIEHLAHGDVCGFCE